MTRPTDHHTVQQHYDANARRYAVLMRPFAGVRRRAIAQLALEPGMSVLELGCGTGTSFAALRAAVGPSGRVIGLDRVWSMLQVAHQTAPADATTTHLIQAQAEHLPIGDASIDAVLAFYSNDIITNQAAIDQAVSALRPGGRCVLAGAKLTSGPGSRLLNMLTRTYATQSISTPLSLQPWKALEQLGTLVIEQHLGGSAFVARGIKLG